MHKLVKIVISCLCSVAGPASQISRAGNRCSRHQSGPWTYRPIQMLLLRVKLNQVGICLQGRYENQIAEMETFMKQTWEELRFPNLASSQSTCLRMAGQRKAIHRAWRGKKETRARGGTLRQFDNFVTWLWVTWLLRGATKHGASEWREKASVFDAGGEGATKLMLRKHFGWIKMQNAGEMRFFSLA